MTRMALWKALDACLPHGFHLGHLSLRVATVEGEPLGLNQNVDAVFKWQGLRFRSKTEALIAEALERAGVLFLPGCAMRLNGDDGRVTREPDFLVCKDGHWGILEVDGAPYHPPTRTVHDHRRDRLFRRHSIRVVEHFDSAECFENPDVVVQKFLDILQRSS
jgi:hypothetical protein